MKKILKSRIFLVIITMVISVGTTVCGAILYNANQVSYTPSDTNWNVSSVDEALNDLYNTANTKLNSTTATAEEILSGKTAYSRGSLVTGTMANRGAVNATIDPGASYTIPAGYHNGSGKITSKAISGASNISVYNSSGDTSNFTGDVTLTAKKDSILVAYIMSTHSDPYSEQSCFVFNVPSDAILLFANKQALSRDWISAVDFRGYYLPSGGTINLKGRPNLQIIKYALLESK